jgi:hypothetical protein
MRGSPGRGQTGERLLSGGAIPPSPKQEGDKRGRRQVTLSKTFMWLFISFSIPDVNKYHIITITCVIYDIIIIGIRFAEAKIPFSMITG